MGNTAKFMLVGVLAMVIVIAVIWDRQSSDLKKTVSVRAENGKSDGPSPKLRTGESKAEGVIELTKRAPEMEKDAVLNILKEEFPRIRRPEPSVVGPESAAAQRESAAQGAPTNNNVKSYIVKTGESFWTIARDHYGDATLWEKLWKANPRFEMPEDLREGSTIVLPEFKRTRMEVPEEVVAGSIANDGKRYYTVKEGDCLGIISAKFYGTCKKWQLILDANNLVDERSLRSGMKIVIPQLKKP